MEQTAFLVSRHPKDVSNHGGWEMAVRANDLVVGQQVRVVSGPLKGLRGMLAAQANDGRWVLEVADAAHGVMVCIRGQQLTQD